MTTFDIQPYSSTPTYKTTWAGWVTFEQLWNDLTPNVSRLLRYYGSAPVDIPDLIAHAFMRLWQELSADVRLLAGIERNQVLSMVLGRTNPHFFQKIVRREIYLRDLAPNSDEPDDFIIDGMDRGARRQHARYANLVDLRLDLERAIVTVAEKYIDSLPHLAALYYITCDVDRESAAAIAGRSGSKLAWWLTRVVKPLREELCTLLDAERIPHKTWKEQYDAGIHAPLQKVVGEFEALGKLDFVATVRSLAQDEDCKTLMERIGRPKSTVFYLRRTAHQALNAAYRSAYL